MKQIIYTLVIILLSSKVTLGQNPDQTDQIIVKFKPHSDVSGRSPDENNFTLNTNAGAVTHLFQALKIKEQPCGRNDKQHLYIIKFPQGTNIAQVIDELYKTGDIEYAEPDYIGSGGGIQGITPNDQYYYRQWALKNDASFYLSPSVAGADIDMENAWNTEQGDSNIIVGIIDSGIKFDHPEFAGRFWTNYKEIPNNGIDDDSSGYIDDVRGWDFANNDNNATDDVGHGTNVTGILGANGNNAIGYAGVDWNCKLMILKALDKNNSGLYSWWASAIYYAADNGARVINMSVGGLSNSITLQNAVNYALSKNVAVVACMMNANSNTVYYPAFFEGVMAVGSTNPDDTRSNPFFWSPTSGSNYGSHISVTAPGNYIYGLNYQSNTEYNYYWGGTSQATPHVVGLAALLLAQNPALTPLQIKTIIETTAEDRVGSPTEDTPGWDQYYGHGRINAFRALTKFTGFGPPDLQNQDVVLYPNPTNGSFTAIVPPGTQQIQIFNTSGKSILTKNIEGQLSNTLQLADNGIYVVRITVNRQTITRKLIVCR